MDWMQVQSQSQINKLSQGFGKTSDPVEEFNGLKGFGKTSEPVEEFKNVRKTLKDVLEYFEQLRPQKMSDCWDRIALITGPSGIGKYLLELLSAEFIEAFPKVKWVNAESEKSIVADFVEPAQQLGIRLSDPKYADADLVQEVYHRIDAADGDNYLFIFENAIRLNGDEDKFGIYEYLPTYDLPNQRFPFIIITTQTNDWPRLIKRFTVQTTGTNLGIQPVSTSSDTNMPMLTVHGYSPLINTGTKRLGKRLNMNSKTLRATYKRKRKSKRVNAIVNVTGMSCDETLKAGTIKNKVSGDSQSLTVGIDAGSINVDDEKNEVVTVGPSRNSPGYNSGEFHVFGKESSEDNEDSRLIQLSIRPGITIGSRTRGKHTVKHDLYNHVTNSGKGHVIATDNHGDLYVGGKETNVLVHGQDPTSDTSIFNICKPAENGCYKLEKPSCALIINNIFSGKNSDSGYKNRHRKGAEGDTVKLRELFDFLNFGCVMTVENVASDKLKKILDRFREEIKENDYSSCFIFIMSHGSKAVNSILMDDLKVVDLYNDIVYEFSKHEEMKSRAKVFLVQGCRDSKRPPGVPGKLDKLPGLQDVLIAHATSPHFPAGRNKWTRSVYFEVIYRVFRENAQAESLQSLLYKVYNDESLKKRKHYPPVELYGFQDYRFQL